MVGNSDIHQLLTSEPDVTTQKPGFSDDLGDILSSKRIDAPVPMTVLCGKNWNIKETWEFAQRELNISF